MAFLANLREVVISVLRRSLHTTHPPKFRVLLSKVLLNVLAGHSEWESFRIRSKGRLIGGFAPLRELRRRAASCGCNQREQNQVRCENPPSFDHSKGMRTQPQRMDKSISASYHSPERNQGIDGSICP